MNDEASLTIDHALLLAAIWNDVAELVDGGIYVGLFHHTASFFECHGTDAYGCPLLTPEIRTALLKQKEKS